jgi:hypothetical protein
MQFDREELIKLVEAAMERQEKKAKEKHETAMVKWERERTEWIEQYADAWGKFADAIARTLAEGGVIDSYNHKVPSQVGWSGNTAYFKDSREPEYTEPVTFPELRQLLVLLKTDKAKAVSQSALERVGFRKLRDLGLFSQG